MPSQKEQVHEISAGGHHSMIITIDGSLLTCGSNECGQLGRKIPSTSISSSPSQSFSYQSLPPHHHHSSYAKVQRQSQNFSQVQDVCSYEHPSVKAKDLKCDALFRLIEYPDQSNLRASLQRTLSLTQSSLSSYPNSHYNQQHQRPQHHHQQSNGNVGNNMVNTQDWRTCVAGGSHSLAISKDGSVWSWGSDCSGQLGIGEAQPPPSGFTAAATNGLAEPLKAPFKGSPDLKGRCDRFVPAPIPSLRGTFVEAIGAGDKHSLFKLRQREGTQVVLACGDGSQGQLGLLHDYLSSGDISDRSTPEYVDLIGKRVKRSPYSHQASRAHLETLQIGNFSSPEDGTRLRYHG
jgi:hypothetical protein